jgi:CRISPR-associated protein Csm5
MKQTYQLQLTTLTPVCIGTGNKLSPYADYVIDEQRKKIYYIDQELVKNKLAKEPNLIDEYVEGVANGMDNNRSSFNLKNFLKNRLNIDVHKEHRLQLDCEAKGSKELYTIVKNAGLQPYIPGSSLKGAVKTALLYEWLVNETEGKRWVSSFVRNLQNFKERKNLESQLDLALKSSERLSFSDSTLINQNNVIVLETKRIHIGTGEVTIPQVWEAVLEDNGVNIKLGIPEGYTLISDLMNRINKFSLDNNQKEIKLITHWGKDFKNDFPKDFDSLVAKHEEFDEKIRQAKHNEAYLRIGSGKGYFFNSISVALANYDNGQYFEPFLRQYGKDYKFRNAQKFPATRPVDLSSFQPLGWVKFEIEK